MNLHLSTTTTTTKETLANIMEPGNGPRPTQKSKAWPTFRWAKEPNARVEASTTSAHKLLLRSTCPFWEEDSEDKLGSRALHWTFQRAERLFALSSGDLWLLDDVSGRFLP